MQRNRGIVGTVLMGCIVAQSASRGIAAASSATPPTLLSGQELADAPYSYYRIPLQNVSPDLMAWWMDPEHNAKPAIIAESDRIIAESFMRPDQPGKAAIAPQVVTQGAMPIDGDFAQPYVQDKVIRRGKLDRGLFVLPEEVASMVPIPAQKALLVRATAKGQQELERIVRFLDQPLRQVEIEAQFVAMSQADAKALGIEELSPPVGTGVRLLATHSFAFGILHQNYHAALNNLAQQGKAQILSSPRLVLGNNLTGSINSETRLSDVRVQFKSKTGQVVADTATGPNIIQFFLAATRKLTITATINNDDTITLRLIPFIGSVLTSMAGNGEIPVGGSQRLDTTAICKNNDTLALGGLQLEGNETATPDHQMVIFITPRLIR